MTRKLEFFFDFGSPNAYLAYTQLPALCERCITDLVWRPMLLGGVFKATGNHAPGEVPAKGAYLRRDMARFVERYGIEYQFNDAFPINTLTLMRGAVALLEDIRFPTYVDAVFRALWVDNRDLGDPAVFEHTLADVGFEASEFMAAVSAPETKQALIAATDEAVARGVFGAPSFIVDDELFFGQDRLDFVEEALMSA